LERFVWDGDQILYELRAPGGDSLSGGALDALPPYSGDYKQVGRVAYTHGPGIDAPLDLIRMDYNGSDYVVIPHTNWRGEYGAGTDLAGTLYTFDFQWPADFRYAFGDDHGFGDRPLPEWFGSLIQGKRDQTGLMYMRNRYYDPNSGRFTQEDPIGLAGGLNLYGFANGDPINFSDPFGLCPEWLDGIPCVLPTGSDLLAAGATTAMGAGGSEWGLTRLDESGNPAPHTGFDQAAALLTPVLAAGEGLATIGSNPKSGLYVNVDLGNGASVSYSHLAIAVGGRKPGEQVRVKAGAVIGLSGNSGNARGSKRDPHVHVRTRVNKQDCNPRDFFSERGGSGTCGR
jgi:RHS repeat-associated protein